MRGFSGFTRGWIVALAVGLFAACGGEPPEPATPASPEPEAPAPEYVETGDLSALRERGSLRILMPPVEAERMPRRGYAAELSLELAEKLARTLDLEPRVIHIAERDEMFRALEEGRGDLIADDLTQTDERKERFDFSVPLHYTREMLVVRADAPRVARVEDLAGVPVAVRASSSYQDTLEQLRGKVPALQILAVNESLDTEEILIGVAEGSYRAALADEYLVDAVLDYRDDLKAPFALTGLRPVGWAMRRGSPELKAVVDQFLHEEALTGNLDEMLFGDLEAIKKRKVLRVLTRNNAVTSFLYRGEQLGFEFELSRRFAKEIGCRVQIVVPPRYEDLIPWLRAGRGDLIAASMTVTPERSEQVAFGRSYLKTRQTLVVRADEDRILTPEHLAGHRVAVRLSSPHHSTLESLRRAGIDGFEIVEAPEEFETEQLIAGVADGTYETTMADRHLLGIELTWRDDVRGAFELGPEEQIAWAMRPGDTQLKAAVDQYLRAHGPRSEFFNILHKKYFTESHKVSSRLRERPAVSGEISPYDDLFREYGRQFGIDWRLLAAQSFQESRFDVSARSWAGAIGLMQMMPRTARSIGVNGDLRDPGVGIEAGARYLRRLADQHYPELPFTERLRFALGAYNGGPGHIADARRIARQKGLNPDVWFDNVEAVLPLLSRRDYAQKARYGYCRCQEAVRYVAEIDQRYRQYARVVD